MTSALHGPKMVHAKESPVRVKQMAVTIEMILQDCLSMHGIFGVGRFLEIGTELCIE